MKNVSLPASRNGTGPCRSVRARPLRLITYLSPNLFWFHSFISRYLAERLRCPMKLVVGSDYSQLPLCADIAFVCSLPYVEHTRLGAPRIEPLVAPVLKGERYGGKPIYFSDVIVRRESPIESFADLRGRSWAYNEPQSQSGYGITRFHLATRGETNGYFGRVVEAGWHERAIHMVCSGEVDASAIDSHVLDVALRQNPSLADRLRIIDTLGPSTIQPIVVARSLPEPLKSELRDVFLGMADDPRARPQFERALVERFEQVTDATYDDVRHMLAVTETNDFLTLR
jgi:phosphonate transport system substrate-binding protein